MSQNIFYYSNYCQHSQKVFQFLVRANLTTEINCVCIDKRGRDPNTNQLFVIMQNGDKVLMPPNINSVPALLMLKMNYNVVYGYDIIKHYEPNIMNDKMAATNFNGEPSGFHLGGNTIFDMGKSAGNSLAMSYTGKEMIITPPMESGNNKIKDPGDSVIANIEAMRKAQDSQLGIGQGSTNPFLKPIM
jgi:hypothetical protein